MKNKKYYFYILMSVLSISCKETDIDFTERLIKTFKSKSINKEKVDWENFEKLVLQKSKISRDSAIILALTLNDNPHTYYLKKNKPLFGNFKAKQNDTCYIDREFDEKKLKILATSK